MRPRIQSSFPQEEEEEEHPYELLLTAETKKLGVTDGRTKGTVSLSHSWHRAGWREGRCSRCGHAARVLKSGA